jgi:hypothetical protein
MFVVRYLWRIPEGRLPNEMLAGGRWVFVCIVLTVLPAILAWAPFSVGETNPMVMVSWSACV